MKSRIIACALIVVLIICIVPWNNAEAASDVCFISINDTLLDLSITPAFVGGTVYVPITVFNSFKIYSSVFSESATASLYTNDKQLYFDLNDGTAYDGSSTSFPAQAIYRNGQIYVTAVSVCSFFGLSCSYISGNGYGDILRLKDANVFLSDRNFLSAASFQMKTRYNEYMSSLIGTPEPSTPNVSPSPSEIPDISHYYTSVSISFIGLPQEDTLRLLKKYGASACFFLNQDNLLENPDLIRKILGYGNSIGVLLTESASVEYEEFSDLLFEIAQEKTIFVASSPDSPHDFELWAKENSLVLIDFEINTANLGMSAERITSKIENQIGRPDMCFGTEESETRVFATVIKYLSDNKYTLRPLREGDINY